jgi:DNA modification methylase
MEAVPGRQAVKRFINKVFHEDARRLLDALPDAVIDSVIADPMYGVSKRRSPLTRYTWGFDPCDGDPDKWWAYHQPIYEGCRRVLKPGGTLAWAMGYKFRDHFASWFGDHRVWAFSRHKKSGVNAFGHVWVVQTKEQQPVRFPDRDAMIYMDSKPSLLKLHPCPKSLPEMLFMVEALTQPAELVLDVFAGTGTTLAAAGLLKRCWLGCDISGEYCCIAKKRLNDLGLLPNRRTAITKHVTKPPHHRPAER